MIWIRGDLGMFLVWGVRGYECTEGGIYLMVGFLSGQVRRLGKGPWWLFFDWDGGGLGICFGSKAHY